MPLQQNIIAVYRNIISGINFYTTSVFIIIFAMGFYFIYFDILLFNEANDWFFVAYAIDFIKNNSTEVYKMASLNTPNSLFHIIYMYISDIFFFLSSYDISKIIMFSFFTFSALTVYKLINISTKYVILLPLLFSYIFSGGMVNYFIGISIILFFILRSEIKGKLPLFELFVFSILIYQAHFMAFFPFMLFILYRYGFKTTVILSVIPFVLLVTYKLQYTDYHSIAASYDVWIHIMSLRRVLLPIMVDVNYYPVQYFFAAIVNFLYAFGLGFLLLQILRKEDKQNVVLFALVFLFYMLFPRSLDGSGVNIHERLIVPFLIFVLFLTKNVSFKPVFVKLNLLIAIYAVGNFYISQLNFDYENYDYFSYINTAENNNPLINRMPVGNTIFKARHMINNAHCDTLSYPIPGLQFFASSIVTFKNRQIYEEQYK